MKPFLLLFALSSLSFPQDARPQNARPQNARKPDGNWVLTFADEFNGKELDLARWVPHDPSRTSRDLQLQAYAPESLALSGGQLHIVARRTAANEIPVHYDGQDREYISGVVTTYGTFAQTYGRFEIRCRIPAGQGLRPGFLLRPVPLSPLPGIDVFETAGSVPSKIFFANRWGTEQTERSFADSFTVSDLSADFHIIAVEWERNQITWSVDGKERFRSVDGIPHQPMYLLIDLAVGGRLAHAPDQSTALPASFDIDYIRVYQHPE
jgi:beta-glucanase (GH16 family)